MPEAYVGRFMVVSSLSISTERLKGDQTRRVVDVDFEVPDENDSLRAALADDEFLEARNSLSLRFEANDPQLSLLTLGTRVQVTIQGLS